MMEFIEIIVPIIAFIIGFNFGLKADAKPITVSNIVKDTKEEIKEIVKPVTPKGIKEAALNKKQQEELDELNRVLQNIENYDGTGKFN